MIDFNDKNVLVTGGSGMIGKALVELLYDTTSANITVADLPNVDLRDRKDCKAVCESQDIVFHLAGIKGSPQRCMESPASFSVPMIQFNANMVEAAYNADVEWFLYTSSVGVYHPAEVFVEDDVWKTFPSENDWFAGWAKRIGEMNVESYVKEYDWNKCSIVRPANVYGINDNFGQWSMVVPSLIKKAMDNDVLSVWGDGSPIRDLIYAEDVARGMIHMVENEVTEPVNLGSGTGVTIREVAEIIAKYFDIDIEWDVEKPMGDMKRLMSTKRAESYGFSPKVSLEEGIIKTIEWYEENRDVLQK
jgi:GDP-L-fucose synthase|tara:strand:+ start:322 stop:1233 length:912 start_codon:yes stop_codon:yes gene_type:complete